MKHVLTVYRLPWLVS